MARLIFPTKERELRITSILWEVVIYREYDTSESKRFHKSFDFCYRTSTVSNFTYVPTEHTCDQSIT